MLTYTATSLARLISMLKKQVFVLMLLQVCGFANIAAQSATGTASDGRINASFDNLDYSASRRLYLFYNYKFFYSFPEFTNNNYATGTYYIRNDSIFLVNKLPEFIHITATSDKTIPKGKIKIVLNDTWSNAAVIRGAFYNSDDREDLPSKAFKKEGNNLVYMIDRPADDILELTTETYEPKGILYELKKNNNEFRFAATGTYPKIMLAPTCFVWHNGSNLRTIAGYTADATFERLRKADSSYTAIPWANSKPEISEEAFNDWRGEQLKSFNYKDSVYAKTLAKMEQLKKEAITARIVPGWEMCLQKAQQDTTLMIMAIFGADSIDVYNPDYSVAEAQPVVEKTDSSGNEPRIEETKPAAENLYIKKWIPEYYAGEFINEEGKAEKNVIINYTVNPDEQLKKQFAIANTPAIVITNYKGLPLFKLEGYLPESNELVYFLQDVRRKVRKQFADALMKNYASAVKDSLYLVGLINFLADADDNTVDDLYKSGISFESLTDSLVTKYISKSNYSAAAYDLLLSNIGPQSKSKVLFSFTQWLFDHYATREADTSQKDKWKNDSTVSFAYCQLIINQLIYGLNMVEEREDSAYHQDAAKDTVLLNNYKKLITGYRKYRDLIPSFLYLNDKYKLIKQRKIDKGGFEDEINQFLDRYAGASTTFTAVTDSAEIMWQSAGKGYYKFLLGLQSAPYREQEYIDGILDAVAYFKTMLAITKMENGDERLLSASLLKTTGAMPLLKMANELSVNSSVHTLYASNYAYALFIAGDNKNAIKLLENAIAAASGSKNKRVEVDKYIPGMKANLIKMKTGKEIGIKLTDMLFQK